MSITVDPSPRTHIVTTYRDALAVLRAPGWSSRPRPGSALAATLPSVDSALLFLDPPDHTRLRRTLAPWFSARAVEPLRPYIRSIITAVIVRLGRDAGLREVELVRELARIVPIAVITELFGLGIDEADVLAQETPRLARLLEEEPTTKEVEAATGAALHIMMMLTPVIAERRSRPGNDLLSSLLSEPDLSLNDVLMTALLLLTAGHETTASLIANSTLALVQERDHIPVLCDSPDLVLEELLRLHGPVKLIGRTALTPHTLSDLDVTPGDYVVIDVHRANRDPEQFLDPERLNVNRPPSQNLAFGSGAHYCLGAALARMETAETLQLLFAHYPDIKLADEPIRWRESTSFHALSTLPVLL